MESFLSMQEVQALRERHRRTRDRRQADRIKTILALNEGHRYEEIARLLLLDDSTIRKYEQEYRDDGIDVLLTDDYKGKEPQLSEKQEHFLRLHLRSITYQMSYEVVAYVEQRFGVTYSVAGITKLLHRLNFVYKKPKVVPGKADKAKQEAFLKEYETLKANKKPEDIIYFGDGCHPHHNPIPAYGWIEKGKEKQIKTNTGRQRVNLHGAINSEDVTDAVILSEPTINADSVIRLCERLLTKHVTGIIYLIIDNARYYHAVKVKEYLRAHSRIQMIFLPSYAPNLNLIERLWLFFQKKILYNTYYKNFADFERKCLYFFTDLKRYRKDLESLLTDNFQVIGA